VVLKLAGRHLRFGKIETTAPAGVVGAACAGASGTGATGLLDILNYSHDIAAILCSLYLGLVSDDVTTP